MPRNEILGLSMVCGTSLLSGCDFLSTTSGKALMEYILQATVLIVTPIALLLANRAVKLIEKKTGLTASQQQLALIDNAVYKGIAYAEELGRNQLKNSKVSLKSEEKRELAIDFALDFLHRNNARDYTRDFLVKLVEAHVNIHRAPSVKRVSDV